MADDFFDVPPLKPSAEPVRYRAPEWAGPPHGVAPAVVALDVLLGRSDRAVVLLSAADVYPAGVSLRLLMLVGGELGDVDPGLFGSGRRGSNTDAERQRALCFGVQFSDGARATNLDYGSPAEPNGPFG